MQTILYPGTFDPITLGHQNLVERVSKLFTKITVAIALSPRKDPMFSLEQRVTMAKKALAHIDNVNVIGFEGLIMDLVKETNASAVLRGVRSMTDFDYELAMAMTNKELVPQFETIFLCPEPEFAHISSTFVREISRMGGDVSKFIHSSVNQTLLQTLKDTEH